MKTSVFFAVVVLAVSLAITASRGWSTEKEYGFDYYSGLAMNGMLSCQIHTIPFSETNCQPTAYRFPVYPIVLGVVERLFGGEAGAWLFQSVLLAMITFVTCQLAARQGGYPAIPGIALALDLLMYVYASWLETELLYTFLTLVLLVTLYRKQYVASGLLTGVILLTRGTFLLTVPILLLCFIPRRKWLVYGALVVVVLVPWWVRNAIEMHAFIPFTTGTGLVLYGANNPAMYANASDGLPVGFWMMPQDIPGWNTISDLPEIALDHAETQTAIEFVRSQSFSTILRVIAARFLNFWGRDVSPGTPEGGEGIYSPAVLFLTTLPIALLYRRVLDSRLLALCLVFILGALLNGLVFYGAARFTLVVAPEMALTIALWFPLMGFKRARKTDVKRVPLRHIWESMSHLGRLDS